MYPLKLVFFSLLICNAYCKSFNLSFVGELVEKLKKVEGNHEVKSVNPDAGIDIYHFLRKYDYPVETHWVKTEDGYMLRMQRLLGGKNGTFYGKENKPAILLMHGLLSSGMDFVNMGPNKSLGLVLADAGYDVWLGNNRGTTWSRNHVTLNPDTDPEFWQYSFETCGYYDLPAKIDYIIAKTGQPKIFYVGHSQGTSQFFAMSALRPEYNDKIALMSALAPVAYMTHMSSPLLRVVAKYADLVEFLFHNILHWYEILPHSTIFQELVKLLMSDEHMQDFGAFFLYLLCGFNPKQFDKSFLPVIGSNDPAGISTRMIIHYGQEIRSGKFRQYDYGILNIKRYKAASPPDFNISAMTAPIALYYSQNDFFAAVQDVNKLAEQLPNLVKLRLIEDKRFNHLDFIFAKDVNTIINQDLIEFQEKYIPNPEPDNSKASSIISKNTLYAMIALLVCVIFV